MWNTIFLIWIKGPRVVTLNGRHHKGIFWRILHSKSWLTFLIADEVSILANLMLTLTAKMLGYLWTSVTPQRWRIATDTSRKHAQLLTWEIIMSRRLIRLTVETDIFLFTLITFTSRDNLINFWDRNFGSCSRVRCRRDFMLNFRCNSAMDIDGRNWWWNSSTDLSGGHKGETLGLNGGTDLPVGKGSYKDRPASFRLERLISASSFSWDHDRVVPILASMRIFFRLFGYKHNNNCTTSQW